MSLTKVERENRNDHDTFSSSHRLRLLHQESVFSSILLVLSVQYLNRTSY